MPPAPAAAARNLKSAAAGDRRRWEISDTDYADYTDLHPADAAFCVRLAGVPLSGRPGLPLHLDIDYSLLIICPFLFQQPRAKS